jgi:hypothetical protein
VTEWFIGSDGSPNLLQFVFGRILEDQIPPIRRLAHRPGCEQWVGMIVVPTPIATPPPVDRIAHEPRADRVPLNVPAHSQEVFVLLHRNRFITTLVDRAITLNAAMGVPALCVSPRDEVHQPGQIIISLGSNDEVPMIRHQAVGE